VHSVEKVLDKAEERATDNATIINPLVEQVALQDVMYGTESR
jgi:hypothetical protein